MRVAERARIIDRNTLVHGRAAIPRPDLPTRAPLNRKSVFLFRGLTAPIVLLTRRNGSQREPKPMRVQTAYVPCMFGGGSKFHVGVRAVVVELELRLVEDRDPHAVLLEAVGIAAHDFGVERLR